MSDIKTLTRDWIQFLKNNQIVALNSDPNTGKLQYKKKVTRDILVDFLEAKTDFAEDEINSAIESVLATNSAPKSSALPAPEETPFKKVDRNSLPQPSQKRDNSAAADVEYRDVNEDFQDVADVELSEDQIEKVFNILLSKSNAAPAPAKADPQEDMRKIKRLIRDSMSDADRKSLWRLLHE